MSHMGQDLGIYIGAYKFEYTKDSSGNSGQDKVVISNLVIIAA